MPEPTGHPWRRRESSREIEAVRGDRGVRIGRVAGDFRPQRDAGRVLADDLQAQRGQLEPDQPRSVVHDHDGLDRTIGIEEGHVITPGSDGAARAGERLFG